MRTFLNLFNKELFYEQYVLLIEDAKDYEKITRYKMIEDAKKVILSDFNIIAKALMYDRFNDVQAVLLKFNNKGKYEFDGEFIEVFDPIMLYFMDDLIEDERGYTFVINKEILNYFKNFSWTDELYEFKYFEFIALGMLETYGDITYKDVNEIYLQHRPDKYKDYPKMDLKANFQSTVNMALQGHSCYKNAIIHQIAEDNLAIISNNEVRILFDLDYYYEKGRYLIKLNLVDENTPEDKAEMLNLGLQLGRLIHGELQNKPDPAFYLESEEFLQNSDLQDYKDIMLDWPIWQYGGESINDIKEMTTGTIDESIQDEFLRFTESFIKYSNHKYRYYKNVKTNEEAYDVLKKSIKRKNIIEGFKRSRFYPQTENSDQFIKGLQEAVIIERGFAIDYFNEKLIVYYEGCLYHVSGITHGIDANIPPNALPLMIEFVLIPLENALTYGISMLSFPIFGLEAILPTLNQDIETATEIHDLSDLLVQKNLSYPNIKH